MDNFQQSCKWHTYTFKLNTPRTYLLHNPWTYFYLNKILETPDESKILVDHPRFSSFFYSLSCTISWPKFIFVHHLQFLRKFLNIQDQTLDAISNNFLVTFCLFGLTPLLSLYGGVKNWIVGHDLLMIRSQDAPCKWCDIKQRAHINDDQCYGTQKSHSRSSSRWFITFTFWHFHKVNSKEVALQNASWVSF